MNLVAPGWTETDMFSRALDMVITRTGRTPEQARAAVLAHNPMGRAITPAEVAALVLYLASPAASSLTGAALPVDGGEAPLSTLRGAPDSLLAAVRVAQPRHPR